jgi:hypothetical protein
VTAKNATIDTRCRDRGRAATSAAIVVPHSWSLANWPASVWPNDPDKAHWVIRSNKSELIAAGAISRIRKTIVIIGQPYVRWVERRVTRVADYQGNNPAIRKSSSVARSDADHV